MWIEVDLRIESSTHSSREIAEYVGHVPSSVTEKGERVSSLSSELNVRAATVVLFSTGAPPGSNLEQHLEALRTLLASIKGSLAGFDGADVYIGGEGSDSGEMHYVDPETINLMAARGVGLMFDVYCPPSDDVRVDSLPRPAG